MFRSMKGLAAQLLMAVVLLSLGACGGGGSSQEEKPPTAVIHAAAMALSGGSSTTITAPLGSTLTLDGSASTADATIQTYAWTVSKRPAGSTAAVQNAGSAVATFVADVAGSYEFTLTVTAGSQTASAVLPVTVTEAVPVVQVDATVNFAGPVSELPAQSLALGSVIAIDASMSRDASGGTVGIGFTLTAAPNGSTAALATTGAVTRLTPDLPGRYQVRVRATAASGLYADAIHSFDVAATAPTVVVASSVTSVSGSSSLAAAVGNLVALNGAWSTVPSGNGSGTWTIQSKPALSTLSKLTNTSANAVSFVPDAPGTYILQFALVDVASGATSFHQVRVDVVVGPTAIVSASAAPIAQASGPSYVGAVGAAMTLRGTGSYDPNGETLSYSWVLDTQPSGSAATLADASTATPSFTPDKDGRYSATLTVTNASGLRAVTSLSVYVGNYPPVVVLDRSQQLLLLGNAATASAGGSYSQNGGTLTYQWNLDTRPTGSTATLANPTQSTLSFTPDLAGTYYASVTVTDGTVSSVSGVGITVLATTAGTVPLTYKPLYTRYSKALGKVLLVSGNPNQLHLVDPGAATDVAISLPAAVKAISVSADGKLAGVLHEGSVSLIDLTAAALIHTSSTGGAQTEVFTASSGIVYVTGQTGGQWVSPPITAINGRDGTSLGTGGGFADIYGVTRGVMAESLGRLFTLSEGLSPADIHWTAVTPATGAFGGSSGDSPYHGDYPMSNPMWLSGDDGLIFTASGTYFNTSTLNYVGNLGTPMLWVSHSSTAAELLGLASNSSVWYYGPTDYPSVAKRYTGSLLLPGGDVALPLVGGAQSYGIAVFHDASDKRVMVVQTGSSLIQASNASYFVLLR